MIIKPKRGEQRLAILPPGICQIVGWALTFGTLLRRLFLMLKNIQLITAGLIALGGAAEVGAGTT